MNDIEKQETGPSEPEMVEPSKLAKDSDSTQTPSKAPMRAALLALILALSGLVVSYMKSSDLNDALQLEKQELDTLKKQLKENKGRLDKADQSMSTQESVIKKQDEWLKQKTEEMQQSLDLVYERVGRSSTHWIVAEAEYLMRIANHRLQLEGDSVTALVALERADKRLHDSGDPAWTAVREKLATEMAELKGLRRLDLAGQAAKLTGLISQVEKLKLPHSVPQASPETEERSKDEKEFSFDRALKDFWGGFKALLKIRRSDRPVTTMLEPDQRFFLYQNLRLQLEGARLALLRRDKPLFDASMQRVEAWIQEFFDQDDALTKGMLNGVNELRGLELEAKMPDISGSLRLLLEQQGQVVEEPERAEPEPEMKQIEEKEMGVKEEQKQVDDQQTSEESEQPEQEGNQPEPDPKQEETQVEKKVAP